MPTTSCPSTSTDTRSGRRPGVTLLELLIAAGIGVTVIGLIMNAYFGANKAQAVAIGTSALKTGGQKAINQIYQQLHQNRHLFDRNDVTPTFLGRLPIRPYDTAGVSPGLPSPDPNVDLRLPLVVEDGTFLKQDTSGTTPPGFDEASPGNCLYFATIEPPVDLRQAAPAAIHSAAFGGAVYSLGTTRLHFYYPTRRSLAATQKPVRPGLDYVYNLTYWQSAPYVDYRDLVKWMNRVKDTGDAGANALIDAKLNALKDPTKPVHFAGALDVGAADASMNATPGALFDLTATSDRRNLVRNTTARFATGKFGTAVDFGMKSSFGEPMVAFNTSGSSPVPINGLDVPAYANDAATYPFGFEVMVAGAAEYRRVLLRLSLAARSSPGGTLFGQTFQQIVQIYEYGGANALPTPTPTPGT